MKTIFLFRKRFLFLVLVLLSILSACSPVEPLPKTELATLELEQDHSESNKGKILEFYPHEGNYADSILTAEYRPSEKIIYITTPYRLNFKLRSIHIIEAPDCLGSEVRRAYGCNYHHYNIELNRYFIDCMSDTQHGIHVEYDYYSR